MNSKVTPTQTITISEKWLKVRATFFIDKLATSEKDYHGLMQKNNWDKTDFSPLYRDMLTDIIGNGPANPAWFIHARAYPAFSVPERWYADLYIAERYIEIQRFFSGTVWTLLQLKNWKWGDYDSYELQVTEDKKDSLLLMAIKQTTIDAIIHTSNWEWHPLREDDLILVPETSWNSGRGAVWASSPEDILRKRADRAK